MPPTYMGEAIKCAVYVWNRTPRLVREEMLSPFHRLRGKTAPFHHLRVFGCRAFVRIVHRVPDKSEERGEEGVMVGYDENTRAYRILVKKRQKVVISEDVIFHEKLHPLLFLQQPSQLQKRKEWRNNLHRRKKE